MYQPLMRRLARHGHDNRYAVSDEGSHGLLMGIKGLLDVSRLISIVFIL